MNWWRGSSPPMRDCRSSRQPANLDASKSAAASARREAMCRHANRNSGPMARSALPMTEVLVVADCWQAEPDAEAVIHRAIAAAAEIVDADIGEAELAVMLTDDAGIRTLNSNWRGIDKPTNVLSFPALQPTGPAGPDDAPRMLGDIAIAYETTRREADDEAKAVRSSSQPSGGAWLPASDRLRPRKRRRRRGDGKLSSGRFSPQLGIPDPYAERDRMRTGSG